MLMILVAPLFVFHAVLIDFLRVRMAERETESALKLALRSTLSAYDPELKEYGLYAIGLNDADAAQLFQHVLQRNMGGTGQGDSFTIVRPLPDPASVSLTSLYTLGNQTVMRQQVLEEMKYRAPAEFTVNVLDKLLGGRNPASTLSGASAFEKRAEAIEELVVSRDRALDEAWDRLLRLQEKSGIFHSYFAVRLGELDDYAARIGGHDVAEIEQSIRSLRSQSEQLGRSLASQQVALQELYKQAKENIQLIMDMQRSISMIQNSLSTVAGQIEQWQTILREIAEFTLLLETSKAEAARDAAVLKGIQDDILVAIDEAQSFDEKIRELSSSPDTAMFMSPELLNRTVLPVAFYALYKVEATAPSALSNGFASALQATSPLIGDNRWTPERYGILSASNEAYAERANRAVAKLQEEESKRQQSAETTRRQKREQLTRLGEVLDQVKKLVAECGGVLGGRGIYDKLHGSSESPDVGLYAKYMQYNRFADTETEPLPDFSQEADQVRRGAFRFVDSLLLKLASAAQTFRDELYVNEFALEKFNYRTFGKESSADGKPIPATSMTKPAQHALLGQEAEYVLYGQSSCLLNQSAAYAEMFALRLAIRTTEAMLSPSSKLASIGSPLLMVLWAAAEGALEAYRDMTDLVNGKAVPLSAKLAGEAVTMQYKDYLRLFYLLHSNDKRTMARMQGLIEVNTGRDLTGKATYVQGSVTASERLWFFPYFETLFAYEVKRNRVLVAKTAFSSY
ncbi:hypothetical protein ACI5FR_21295 [Paenibacillus sp. HJGM_3]